MPTSGLALFDQIFGLAPFLIDFLKPGGGDLATYGMNLASSTVIGRHVICVWPSLVLYES